MKRNKLTIIMIITIVACLLAAAMVLVACNGGGGNGGSSSGGSGNESPITKPVQTSTDPVYHISAKTTEDLLVFSWENVNFTQLRLYNERQNDEITVPAGDNYVELPFTTTVEYSLEYFEGGKWNKIRSILFYKKEDIDSSLVTASYAKDGQITLTWQQTDYADMPYYEIVVEQAGDESVEKVIGTSYTRALTAGEVYRMRFREIADITVDASTQKIIVPYSYWSDPIDVCLLASAGQIAYDDKTEKIEVNKVQRAFGYKVTAYSQDKTLFSVRPSEEPGSSSSKVRLAFHEIAGIYQDFKMRVEPIGTDNVVDMRTGVGRLYITQEKASEADITICDPISRLSVTGEYITWKKITGCSYYICGTNRQVVGGAENSWAETVPSTNEDTVYFSSPYRLAPSTVVELTVKPLYQTQNTFSHAVSLKNLYITSAPQNVKYNKTESDGFMMNWTKENRTNYTIRMYKDGELMPDPVKDPTAFSFTLSGNSIAAGSYEISVAGVSTEHAYTICYPGQEEEAPVYKSLTYYSTPQTIIKLAAPSYKVSHLRPGTSIDDTDSIRIEIQSADDRYVYNCARDSGNSETINNGVVTLKNTKDVPAITTFELKAVEYTDAGDAIVLPSKKASVKITKAPRFTASQSSLSIGADGITLPQTANYIYSFLFQKVGDTRFDKGDLNGNYIYNYTTFLTDKGTLDAGKYTLKVTLSYGYSTGDVVEGDSEATQEGGKTRAEYTLDGVYDDATSVISFTKNTMPTLASFANMNLSVQGNTNDSGSYAFYLRGESLQSSSSSSFNVYRFSSSFLAGDNVISVIRLGASANVLSSDAFEYTVQKLATPEISVSRGVLSVSSVEGAVRYGLHSNKDLDGPQLSNGKLDLNAVNNMTGKFVWLNEPDTHTITVQAIGDGTVLDSDSAEWLVTRFKAPTLAYRDEKITLSGINGRPSAMDCYFYASLDPDSARQVYRLTSESYSLYELDLTLASLTARLSLSDTVMKPGKYEVTFACIGDGATTLDSAKATNIEFRKQAVPELSFVKGDAGVYSNDAYVPATYSVEIGFGRVYDETTVTAAYSYRTDNGNWVNNGAVHSGVKADVNVYYDRYAVSHVNMQVGRHTYSAFLNNDNENHLLPSDVATIDYYKLAVPTFSMNEEFTLSWSTNGAGVGGYYFINKITRASTSTGNASALTASELAEVTTDGTVEVYALGDVMQRAIDSDKGLQTYTRATAPVISFESVKGAATDNSKITWTYDSDATYSFRFTGEGAASLMTAAISGKEAVFPGALSGGNHTFSLIECGLPSAFRLPSFSSNEVSITKLSTVQAFNKGDTLTWDPTIGATEYILVKTDGTVLATVNDPAYDWRQLDTGDYTLQVIARSTDTSANYLDADRSVSVGVTKLAKPNVTIGASLTWDAVSYANGYSVKINGYNIPTNETAFSLFGMDDGSYSVSIMAKGSSASGDRIYLNSEETSFTLTISTLSAPTALRLDGKKVKWDAVSNAIGGYSVSVNGSDIGVMSECDLSTYGKGTYSFSVIALGGVSEYTYYRESENSDFMVYVEELDAPELSLENNVISWTIDENASGSMARIDEGAWDSKMTEYDAKDFSGTHTLSVKAVGKVTSNTIYLDNEITYTMQRIVAPVLRESNKEITWDIDPNAVDYLLSLNGGVQVSMTVYVASELTDPGTYLISVIAVGKVGDGVIYLNSLPGELEYTVEELSE